MSDVLYNWYSWKRFYQHYECIKSSASGGGALPPAPTVGANP